jgi:DNA-binding NarL/FixJ family response regulator
LRKLLIADDHEAIRKGVRSFVASHTDWRIVAEASNGHEALGLAKQTQPDVAIIDYSLPQMNGLELTQALKREVPRTEILIYTMHDREDIVQKVLRAGARGYVLKSDPGPELIAAIEALCMHKPYFSGAVSETLLDHFLEASRSSNDASTLTTREREVAQLIAEGKINKEMAHILDISVKTVETHRASVMHKLNLKTTADLVRYAVRNNIIEP